jgi:hypothetical protein
MTSNRTALFATVSLVFASGILVGALGHRYYNLKSVAAIGPAPNRSPEEYRKRYMTTMRERLKLTDGQQEKLDAILDETRDRYRVFWEKHGDERKQIEDGQVTRVNAILEEGQRAEYAKMRKEREDRRKAAMDAENKSRSERAPASETR